MLSNSVLRHLSGTTFIISCRIEQSHWRFYEKVAQSPPVIVEVDTIRDCGGFTVWKLVTNRNSFIESWYLKDNKGMWSEHDRELNTRDNDQREMQRRAWTLCWITCSAASVTQSKAGPDSITAS